MENLKDEKETQLNNFDEFYLIIYFLFPITVGGKRLIMRADMIHRFGFRFHDFRLIILIVGVS